MDLDEPDWQGAWMDLKKCIELDPVREIEVYIKRGRCAMRLEDFSAARDDAEYYLSLLDSQEGSAPAADGDDNSSNSAFEGRLLRAHLYIHEAERSSAQDLDGDGIVTKEEVAKSVKRAVMDYDYVVNTYNPAVDTVRRIYPEAHYCVARLIPHSPEFLESTELAREATDRFLKAWNQGVREPLRHCVEMVVAERRLEEVRVEAAKAAREEAGEEAEGEGPPSLRSLCAAALTRKGKYGGKSMPGHFHIAIAQMLAKGPIPEDGTPPTQQEWVRAARHMTLGWKNKASLEKHVGLAGLAISMGRRKMDADGNVQEESGYPSLVSQAVSAIVADEEAFPSTMAWMELLRVTGGGGGGGKKK